MLFKAALLENHFDQHTHTHKIIFGYSYLAKPRWCSDVCGNEQSVWTKFVCLSCPCHCLPQLPLPVTLFLFPRSQKLSTSAVCPFSWPWSTLTAANLCGVWVGAGRMLWIHSKMHKLLCSILLWQRSHQVRHTEETRLSAHHSLVSEYCFPPSSLMF